MEGLWMEHNSKLRVTINAAMTVDGKIATTCGNSRILKTAHRIATIVVVSERAHDDKIDTLRSTGAMVIIAGRETVDLREALLCLRKMGFKNILAEGGGELNWSLLDLGIVDQLIVTVSPKLVGGRSATTLVEGAGYETISQAINVELKKVHRQ